MQEIWENIKGYEGFYEASNLGNIKSLERKVWTVRNKCFSILKEKILKQTLDKVGYLTVNLHKNGKSKAIRVHLLVWDAFGDSPRNGRELQVDHIDNNKIHNSIENLQILTSRQNTVKYHLSVKKNGLPTGVYKKNTAVKKKYYSIIRLEGRLNHLGYFLTKSGADLAYQKALISNGLF